MKLIDQNKNMRGEKLSNSSSKGYDRILNWIPDAIIDLKYASNDNFIGEVIYDKQYDLLRVGTLMKLKRAAHNLRLLNYRIVIWDAYRPLAVQKVLWDRVQDDRFVANPETGSNHNRGCAVDVTLADLNGNILDMPSPFDDFTHRAHAFQSNLDPKIKKRLIDLQESMVDAGFECYRNEWWHFNDTEWQEYLKE